MPQRYDVEAERKRGTSDKEILDFLIKTRTRSGKFDLEKALAAGHTYESLIEHYANAPIVTSPDIGAFREEVVNYLDPVPGFKEIISKVGQKDYSGLADLLSGQVVSEGVKHKGEMIDALGKGEYGEAIESWARSRPGGSWVIDLINKLRGGEYERAAGQFVGTGVPYAVSGATSLVRKPLARVGTGRARKQYAQMLDPTTREMKAKTAKVLPGLLEKAPVASREGLLRRALQKTETLEPQIKKAYNALPPGTKTNVKPVWEMMEKIKNRRTRPRGTDVTIAGSESFRAAIERLQQNLLDMVGIDESIMRTPGVTRVKVDTMRLVDMKRILGKVIEKSKKQNITVADLDTVDASKIAQRYILRELDAQFPDIAKINKEFAFWKNVEEVVDATIERTRGHKKPLIEVIIGAGAAGGGIAHGGWGEGLLTGAIAAGLVSLIRSPGWKSVSAVTKAKIAKHLANGNIHKATLVATPVILRESMKQGTESDIYDYDPKTGELVRVPQ